MIKIIYLLILLNLLLYSNDKIEKIDKFQLSKYNNIELNSYIESLSIREWNKKGKRKIYIFSSVDCKYCKALRVTLDEDGVNYRNNHIYMIEYNSHKVLSDKKQYNIKQLYKYLKIVGYPMIFDSNFKQYRITDIVDARKYILNTDL